VIGLVKVRNLGLELRIKPP